MAFLGAALGTLAGSLLGGSSASSASNNAAQQQQQLLQQQEQFLQQAGADARGSINSALPYTQGASGAAAALRSQVPYLTAGTGSTFGGQQVQSTPTPSFPQGGMGRGGGALGGYMNPGAAGGPGANASGIPGFANPASMYSSLLAAPPVTNGASQIGTGGMPANMPANSGLPGAVANQPANSGQISRALQSLQGRAV